MTDKQVPPEPAEPPPPASVAAPEPPDAPRRRRLSPAGAAIAVLLAVLGFALAVQLRTVATDPALTAARQEDLVRILSELESRERRLREDLAELESTQRELTTAGRSYDAALAEATRRADEMGILAGTVPAQGPGVVVDIRGGGTPVAAIALLDAIQELRGAGAEAMQISGVDGAPVRVVASTYVVDAERGILVDGRVLMGPYAVTAIGDPQTLRTALNIPGGVVESVGNTGGTVIVHEPGVVTVSALRPPTTLQHAQPVS